MLFGITGSFAAGKDEVSTYLKTKGFASYALSDMILEVIKQRGLPIVRESYVMVGNELRKMYGGDYLASTLLAHVKEQEDTHAVITGVRNSAEAQALQRAGAILIGVHASKVVRFKRLVKRGRPGDIRSFEEFVAAEQRENSKLATHQQLDTCFAMATHRIDNNGTKEELYRQVDSILMEEGWK